VGLGDSRGIITTSAMLALYRGFEIGKLALVGPISASYPALTVILSLLSGERLSLHRILGIVAALGGVILVAAGEKTAGDGERMGKLGATAGLGWAIAAAFGFGVVFWLLGIRMIPRSGALATVWLIRITGALITFTVVLAKRIPMRVKNKRTNAQLYTMGFFDTGAFALSNLGMRMEQIAIMSVLGSLYGAVTVGFAAIFLKEHISVPQWLGITSIILGVALINV